MNSLTPFNKMLAATVFMVMAVMTVGACAAYRLYPVVIHTAAGAQMFQVEMVDTPERMASGLMYRKALAADHGMLFIFGDEQPRSFWMKNTLIPLDMLFIKQDGRIATLHAMAKPLDETPLSSDVPVYAVLEIAGGEAEKRGIKIGDKVETSLLPGQKQ